jgi:chromosome segregation ATPase
MPELQDLGELQKNLENRRNIQNIAIAEQNNKIDELRKVILGAVNKPNTIKDPVEDIKKLKKKNQELKDENTLLKSEIQTLKDSHKKNIDDLKEDLSKQYTVRYNDLSNRFNTKINELDEKIEQLTLSVDDKQADIIKLEDEKAKIEQINNFLNEKYESDKRNLDEQIIKLQTDILQVLENNQSISSEKENLSIQFQNSKKVIKELELKIEENSKIIEETNSEILKLRLNNSEIEKEKQYLIEKVRELDNNLVSNETSLSQSKIQIEDLLQTLSNKESNLEITDKELE